MDLILTKHKILDFAQEKIKKPTNDAQKEKYREIDIITMNLLVNGVKENLIPYISNIYSSQEMYEVISKLFTIKNIGKITSLKNEIKTIKMTKDDIVSSYFLRISRIRDELQAIDEVVPNKELVIVALFGLPKSWSSFATGISSWKYTPTFEQMWNACSQEEACISLVSDKKEDEENNTSNSYSSHQKKKGVYKKFKGPKKKVDLSKVECYNWHTKGHYKSQCPKNPRNKRTDRKSVV